MPPIEVYEVRDGVTIPVPPGDVSPTDAAAAGAETDAPGATAPPPAGDGQPSTSPLDTSTTPASGGEPGAGEEGDDEPLRDDTDITAARLERRFARLTRLRRQAERQLEDDRRLHNIEMARTRGELDAVQRLLAGAAPPMPETPEAQAGPPHAEQFASHEDYVLAAARYGAQQEFQSRDQQMQVLRQQDQQRQFQQQLMEREQQFKQAHPDFDTVVRSGLAGKVSPVLQQALMLVPDGPAVAYALARQPETVQRLNALPPPLVLVELGRLLPPSSSASTQPPGVGATNGSAPALPAPPTPLSGSGAGAPTGTYRDDMSMDEYKAWRKRTSTLPAWKER